MIEPYLPSNNNSQHNGENYLVQRFPILQLFVKLIKVLARNLFTSREISADNKRLEAIKSRATWRKYFGNFSFFCEEVLVMLIAVFLVWLAFAQPPQRKARIIFLFLLCKKIFTPCYFASKKMRSCFSLNWLNLRANDEKSVFHCKASRKLSEAIVKHVNTNHNYFLLFLFEPSIARQDCLLVNSFNWEKLCTLHR